MARPMRGESIRIVKREPGGTATRGSTHRRTQDVDNNSTTQQGDVDNNATPRQGVLDRRVIRSKYLTVKRLINDERDNISKVDSDKFNFIINRVESLHELVQKTREQVADAEALLDIANTLALSVRSQINGGVTPSDFISSLLQIFGQQNHPISCLYGPRSLMLWDDIGLVVADAFKRAPEFCTVIGPMDREPKRRKAVRKIPIGIVDNTAAEEMTDTDKNMVTMFNILKEKKCAKLEHLVLNRNSFAQTVENTFALSFLVKDGRVEITVDDNNCHFVSPRNAPASSKVLSGEVSYSHFIFQFDFKDWKLMMDTVMEGEELMSHRGEHICSLSDSQPVNSQRTTTPIKTTTLQESPGNS